MPVFPCRWPTCAAYVARRGDYCPAHAEQGRRERADRTRFYDRHVRDRDAKRFYDSARWARARAIKLANDLVCERCRRVFAEHVHHRKPLRLCSPAERTDQRNLMSLCNSCHSAIEAEVKWEHGE
jgi:5-methylcytosine-specific restriction protein A